MIDLDDDIRKQIIIREFAKAQCQRLEFIYRTQCEHTDNNCKKQTTSNCPYFKEAEDDTRQN